MSKTKNIYELGLHEATKTPEFFGAGTLQYIVVRVAGGWIYEPVGSDGAAVFVPYNNDMADSDTKPASW
jgi:hypothetical protein